MKYPPFYDMQTVITGRKGDMDIMKAKRVVGGPLIVRGAFEYRRSSLAAIPIAEQQ
jgi:hypothetical protein